MLPALDFFRSAEELEILDLAGFRAAGGPGAPFARGLRIERHRRDFIVGGVRLRAASAENHVDVTGVINAVVLDIEGHAVAENFRIFLAAERRKIPGVSEPAQGEGNEVRSLFRTA